MHRYLIFFGYSGTRFHGLQKQHKRIPPELMTSEYFKKDEDTVQGALEAAIYRKLKPTNPVTLYTSSRTDTGVHAVANTGHIDLDRDGDTYYDPKVITVLLNTYLRERCLDINVMRTVAVPSWFSARHDAVSRTYLYRLVVSKNRADQGHHYMPCISRDVKRKKNKLFRVQDSFTSVTPCLAAVDHDRILDVGSTFDRNLFQAALSEMVGTHNFASFCNAQGFYKRIKTAEGAHVIEQRTIDSLIKTIDSIDVEKHLPWMPSSIDSNYDQLDFYNVIIRGKSFLHNQVRRMVGVSLGISSGKLAPETVSELLSNPSTLEKNNYPAAARPAPAHGLYLANVGYNKSIELATDDVRKLPLPPTLCPRDDFDWILGPGWIEDPPDDSQR